MIKKLLFTAYLLTGFAGITSGVGPVIGGGGGSAAPTGTGFNHVTSGVQDAAALAETGTGNGVRATSPTFVTPALGVATATSVTLPVLTTDSNLKVGPFEMQGYSLNNCWFGDNIYYNAGFLYRANGYGEQIYFQSGETQFRQFALSTAGAAAGNGSVAMRASADGTVALGGLISTTLATYTGHALVAKAGVNIGGTSDPGAGQLAVTNLIATNAAASTIASAATIAPTKQITFISGTAAIATITAPAPISTGGGTITLIPTGIFTTTTGGNIALASTAVVSKAMTMTYDTTTGKFYPSY